MKPQAIGRAALVCLIAGLILWGCGGAERGQGGVAGTVVARQSDPAPGDNTVLVGVVDATVRWGDITTRTNYSGGFILNGVEEGFQTIRAAKKIQGQTWAGFTTVEVAKEVTVVNANITLWPEDEVGDLIGEVRDEGGRRLSGAKVLVASELGSYTAITNRNGEYELRGIPGGFTYTVTASRVGYENSTKQISVSTGSRTTANFRLRTSFNLALSPPQDLLAVAWTYPDSSSRSRHKDAYDRIRADLLPRFKPFLTGRKAPGRLPPPNSLIEVDLAWTPNNITYPDETNLAGYGIYRQVGNVGGLAALDFIRDPLAGFYGDLDEVFTPGIQVQYRITALGTDYPQSGSESDYSNSARVVPLDRVVLTGPDNRSSTSGKPTFSWHSVPGAEGYLVRIYDNYPIFGLGKPVWQNAPEDPLEAVTSGLSITPGPDDPPFPPGTYYWIVAASDDPDITRASAISVSPIWQFTVR